MLCPSYTNVQGYELFSVHPSLSIGEGTGQWGGGGGGGWGSLVDSFPGSCVTRRLFVLIFSHTYTSTILVSLQCV